MPTVLHLAEGQPESGDSSRLGERPGGGSRGGRTKSFFIAEQKSDDSSTLYDHQAEDRNQPVAESD